MKLAFSTLGCPEWSFEKVVSEAVRLGYGAVELRGLEGCLELGKLSELQPQNRVGTKQILAEAGISFCSLDTSCSFHDPEKLKDALCEGREVIDIASDMEVPYIRVFGNSLPAEYSEEESLSRIADGIRELCLYAEGKNVQVLLEVHGDLVTPERLVRVAENVDRSEFGMIWDVEHISGCTHAQLYTAIKPWIRHVHLKDSYSEDGKRVLCLPGRGDLPLEEIVRMMLADGYDGWFSFEWEKVWHNELPEPEEAFPEYVRMMKRFGR